MIRVSLDGQPAQWNQDAGNIQEILGSLAEGLPKHRVVTEITLDGKQYYPHRQNLKAASPNEFQEIQIRTTDKAVLENNGLDIAISNVRRVQQTLIRVAELYRESDGSQANSLFSQCLESLAKFIETVHATRDVLGIDFKDVHLQNGSLALVEKELNLILEGLDQCQSERNYPELADRIEYELLTNLHTWTHALHRMIQSQER